MEIPALATRSYRSTHQSEEGTRVLTSFVSLVVSENNES